MTNTLPGIQKIRSQSSINKISSTGQGEIRALPMRQPSSISNNKKVRESSEETKTSSRHIPLITASTHPLIADAVMDREKRIDSIETTIAPIDIKGVIVRGHHIHIPQNNMMLQNIIEKYGCVVLQRTNSIITYTTSGLPRATFITGVIQEISRFGKNKNSINFPVLEIENEKIWLHSLMMNKEICSLLNLPPLTDPVTLLSKRDIHTLIPSLYPGLPPHTSKRTTAEHQKLYRDLLCTTHPAPPPWIAYSSKIDEFILCLPSNASNELKEYVETIGFVEQSIQTKAGNLFYKSRLIGSACALIGFAGPSLAKRLSIIQTRWPFLLIEMEAVKNSMEGIINGNKSPPKEAQSKEPLITYSPHWKKFLTKSPILAGKYGLSKHIPESRSRTSISWVIDDQKTILNHWPDLDTDGRVEYLARLIETPSAGIYNPIADNLPFPAQEAYTYDLSQIDGIRHCISRSTSMLSDDMGTGKTVQGTGIADTLRHLKKQSKNKQPFHGLFIIPPDIMDKWCHHLVSVPTVPFHIFRIDTTKPASWPEHTRSHTTPVSPKTAEAQRSALECGSITVLPISRLSECSELLKAEWDLILIDEGHALTKTQASRTQDFYATDENGKLVLKTPFLTSMTGTDITNTMTDYYSQIIAIIQRSESSHFAPPITQTEFAALFASSHDPARDRRIDRIAQALNKGPRIRRLKEHIYKDLPPKMPRKKWIITPDRNVDTHLKTERDIINLLENSSANTHKPLTAQEKRILKTRLAGSRIETSLAKVSGIARAVARIASSEDPILLYAHHTDIADRLGDALKTLGVDVIVAHGKNTSPTERATISKSFNEGQHTVLVTTISALYAGHDIQRTRYVFFAEMDHKVWMMIQCEDRSWRRGQTRNVYIRYFVIPESYDDKIATSIVKKSKTHTLAMGDDITAITLDTNNSEESNDTDKK